MAKVVDAFPPRVGPGRRGPHNPEMVKMRSMTDGRIYLLKKGEDYTVTKKAATQRAYCIAKQMGLKVRTQFDGDDFYVQFYKPEPNGQAAN